MDDQLIIKSFRIIRIEYCFWKIYFFKLKIWLASKINKKNNLKLLKKLTIGKIRYVDYLLSSYSIPTVNLFFLIFASKCIYRCNYNFRIGSRQYLVTKKKKKNKKSNFIIVQINNSTTMEEKCLQRAEIRINRTNNNKTIDSSVVVQPQLFSNGMKFNLKLNRCPVREWKRV